MVADSSANVEVILRKSDSAFVELAKVEDGVLRSKKQNTEYNTFADDDHKHDFVLFLIIFIKCTC